MTGLFSLDIRYLCIHLRICILLFDLTRKTYPPLWGSRDDEGFLSSVKSRQYHHDFRKSLVKPMITIFHYPGHKIADPDLLWCHVARLLKSLQARWPWLRGWRFEATPPPAAPRRPSSLCCSGCHCTRPRVMRRLHNAEVD